jgi:hypothetical protein
MERSSKVSPVGFRSRLHDQKEQSRGQALVETALLLPVLLIVLSGLIEFGFMLNEYLALQDAARNAARFASDGLYFQRDRVLSCDSTLDFYRQAACLANQELAQERPEIHINLGNGQDDIIISSFSVTQGAGVSARHPSTVGWSEAEDATGARNQSTKLDIPVVNSRLNGNAPSTGLVSVEIFHNYDQKLKLPWITAFISDPILLHNYAIMPLVSAEPTPTPIP